MNTLQHLAMLKEWHHSGCIHVYITWDKMIVKTYWHCCIKFALCTSFTSSYIPGSKIKKFDTGNLIGICILHWFPMINENNYNKTIDSECKIWNKLDWPIKEVIHTFWHVDKATVSSGEAWEVFTSSLNPNLLEQWTFYGRPDIFCLAYLCLSLSAFASLQDGTQSYQALPLSTRLN